MSEFGISLEGAEGFLRKAAQLAAVGGEGSLVAAAAAGVAETTIEAHGQIVEAVSQPGTGRVYRREGRTHQASAPGQPPAVDTGIYRSSIHFELPDGADGIPEGKVVTNDKRGPWLEYGTRRMAARPHFGPVAERLKAENTLAKNVARHIEEALQEDA